MSFDDDSRLTYNDELIIFTVQHKDTGEHLWADSKMKNPHYHRIAYNAGLSNLASHLKSTMQEHKTHKSYRQASDKIDELYKGYILFQHHIRTEAEENFDLLATARSSDSRTPGGSIHKVFTSWKISEETFENLYKFKTEPTDYDIHDNLRNMLFNNYITSAGIIKEIPWADYHNIQRHKFLEAKDFKTVYAVESDVWHIKNALDLVNGRFVDMQTICKIPKGIILLEDKQDANLFALMSSDSNLYDITGLMKRMLNHRILR